MTVRVAARAHDRAQTLFCDSQESVRLSGRADSVNRDLYAAVRTVLEPDGHGHARRQFAVDLAFRCPRPYSSPTDEIRNELWRDRIEQLAAGGQALFGEVEKQAPCQPQPLVDLEAAVEVRIIDQPLPSHCRAWLLKVHAHHDAEIAGGPVGEGLQTPGVVAVGGREVDRTRPHHDNQPVVFPRDY